MASTTYDLFFTGRDDPRSCVIIGEGTKPIYFCFETIERNLMPNMRTMVYRNNKEVCAKLEWSPGNHLGGATIGNRQISMSQLVLACTTPSARAFISADGKRFEWRRSRENPTSYDLYAAQNIRIGVFRRYMQATAVGTSHALLQYTFTQESLLIEALIALCVNRWIDLHGIHGIKLNTVAAASSQGQEGTGKPLPQSTTYAAYVNQDHESNDAVRKEKVQRLSQQEHKPDSTGRAAPPLHNTNTSDAESSSVGFPLVNPTIRWVAAQRAFQHAQNQYPEVVRVFAKYEIPESEYSVHAGFDEDLIKSGVGYLEQIHVFVNFRSVVDPPELLLLDLGQLFTPYSAALYTETSAYEIPVFKDNGEAWDFDDFVQAVASKFIDFGLSPVVRLTGNNFSAASGDSGVPDDTLPEGSQTVEEDKKRRSRKGKERERQHDERGNKGESDNDDPSGDPNEPETGCEAVEPTTISFDIVTELLSPQMQPELEGGAQLNSIKQFVTVVGEVIIQNELLDQRHPKNFATRQVTFKQLKFGTTQTPNRSYLQYYTRVIVDPHQKTAHIAMVKPRRTRYYDKEEKENTISKDGKTTNAGLALAFGPKLQAAILGGKTRTKEKSMSSEKRRRTDRITQQQMYGVVRWGFHVDDPNDQEEGVDTPESDLPSASFVFRGESKIPAPPPECIDVEISAYWRVSKPSDTKKPWWPWPWSKSSQNVTFSNLCQLVTLEIPAICSEESMYYATLKLDLGTNQLQTEPLASNYGPTVVAPGMKKTDHGSEKPYDYWKQDSNLGLQTLRQVVVRETKPKENRNDNGTKAL